LLLPGSLALVLLLLLLLPNLAAEPFAAAAAVVVDVVGAAHVGVVADAGNAKREAGAGAGAVVVVLFVVAVAVVDDDDSKCVAAGDWGGCEPMKAREKSHERARKADEVQEDAASCPTETVGPHSLHTAPEIASSISLSLSLSLSLFVALLLLFFKILHTITMCCSFKLRYTCTYFTLSLSMHQISKQSYSAIIAASIAAAAPPPPPPPLPTPPPPFTPSHFLPFFITIISQSDAATTPSHLLRLPLFSIISIISQSDAATPPSHHHHLLLPLFSLIMIMIIKSITSTQRWS
jgi:hypothetical protein